MKIPFEGFVEILEHKPFVALQRKNGINLRLAISEDLVRLQAICTWMILTFGPADMFERMESLLTQSAKQIVRANKSGEG